MTRACAGALGILCFVAGPSMLYAGDLSGYRGFQFGMTISDAAKQAGMNASEAIVVHRHPALIQELDWRPRSPMQTNPAQADPVENGLLYFYDGELFRIVITYDRYKVEGMTAEDLIEAISLTYGTPTRSATEIEYHSNYGETADVMARWEDADYSYNLVQTGNRSSFAMVSYSKRVDAMARSAKVEAVRLETEQAPQREIEKQKKREDDARLALDKARSTNKPNFRP
jgi:hypothetical protein